MERQHLVVMNGNHSNRPCTQLSQNLARLVIVPFDVLGHHMRIRYVVSALLRSPLCVVVDKSQQVALQGCGCPDAAHGRTLTTQVENSSFSGPFGVLNYHVCCCTRSHLCSKNGATETNASSPFKDISVLFAVNAPAGLPALM